MRQRVLKKIKQHSSAVGLFLYLATLLISNYWLWQHSYQQLQTSNQQQLDRFTRHLNTELGHFKFVPQLLSSQGLVISALLSPDNSAQLDLTNRHLNAINDIVNASDIYLLDKQGNTIAASNWSKQNTFIGDNYAFRPYYQEAIKGLNAHYFALGSTSGKRGYYFSFPVQYAAEIIGVIVVKMDLSLIEKDWIGKEQIFLVSDSDDVVFISSQKKWLFKSLKPLSEEKKREVLQSRRYLEQQIQTLPLKGDLTQSNTLIKIPNMQDFFNVYLSIVNSSENNHWNIRVFVPIGSIIFDLIMLSIFISLLYLSIFLLSILLKQNRNRLKEKAMAEIKSKQKLEFTVLQRTSALQAEIEERHKAEAALRSTQDELIQSAKLAVLGQLSASISHELNNPLAAIRSYSENAILFLERDKQTQVKDNLTRISLLTERMAKISSQLKSFARKSNGLLQKIELQLVINAAHELIKPQLKENQTRIQIEAPQSAVYVRAEPIQLEQILINLISNALQAMQNSVNKLINLTLTVEKGFAIISVLDEGTGIDEQHLAKLFDPFFTTKKTGLGLGLSISQQIINNMHGTLTAKNRPIVGAEFSISLPLSLTEINE